MSLNRRTSSWNYSNPIELLLMRQAYAAIQLPSTNYRCLTGEADSHLEKWKWKNKWTEQGALLEIPTEFLTCSYSVSKLTFLLFVRCSECFCFAGTSKKANVYLSLFHDPVLFCSPPLKVLSAKFLSRTILILSIWQTVRWLFFFLATYFNRTETSKDALGLLFCSVSRNIYNLKNIKYSLLCFFLFFCAEQEKEMALVPRGLGGKCRCMR